MTPLWSFVLVALILAAIAAVLNARSGRRRQERIRLLSRYAEALGADEPVPPLPEPLDGALGDLQVHLANAAAAQHRRLDDVRATQHRLEELLGGMIEGVLVIDSAGTVLLINSQAQMLLDLPRTELPLGKPLIELTRHPDLHQLVREVMSGGVQRPFVRDLQLGGGAPLMLQVTATPLPGGSATERNSILVFHDVSDLKRLERIRRDFVANVSHELRTPLAAIRGYAETLLGGAL